MWIHANVPFPPTCYQVETFFSLDEVMTAESSRRSLYLLWSDSYV